MRLEIKRLKLSCDSRFQRAFTACVCIFKLFTFVVSKQGKYFENATACSKRTLKTTVATQLKPFYFQPQSYKCEYSLNKKLKRVSQRSFNVKAGTKILNLLELESLECKTEHEHQRLSQIARCNEVLC